MHTVQITASRGSEIANVVDTPPRHVYEIRPRVGSSGFELISDALPQGRLTFEKQRVASGYARLHSASHPLVIRIFDAAGNLLATHDEARTPECS